MQLALCYKNFAANANISHIGLGVSALNTAKVLKRHGVPVSAFAINSVVDLDAFLIAHPLTTHVVISAAWLPVLDLGKLVIRYPQIEFAVNIHSNVGFLQADSNGVDLLRSYIHLQKELLNFRISGNSEEFVEFVEQAYSTEVTYLPNLYNLDSSVRTNRPVFSGSGTLRIGAFGACRALKNFLTAAGAAVIISKQLRVPVEFWMNGGRPDGGGSIERAIRNLIGHQPGVTLNILNWQPWPDFLDLIATLHLMIQVSYTESFNVVTADGVAVGVPSVVSSAVKWVPHNWQAKSDDAVDVAQVGRALLFDPHCITDGISSLESFTQTGYYAWLGFFEGPSGNFASGDYRSAATTRAIR